MLQPEAHPDTIQGLSTTKRALLIGIGEYPNLLPHQQLPGSINDVALIYDLLSKQFGFPDHNISCLRNEQATRKEILKAFQDFVAVVKKDDIVVIYYSGHGSYIRDPSKGAGRTETIVPYDSGRRSSKRQSTDIKDTEILEQLLEPLTCKTPFVTLFFDACHSGSILRDAFGTAVRGIEPDGELRSNRDIQNTQTSRWVSHMPAFRAGMHERYTLLAACRADERAAETYVDGTPYGAFTYHVCNVTKENPTAETRVLFHLASRKVTDLYPNQHPILEGAQNALIFGSTRLESQPYLGIVRTYDVDGTKMVEMDGGLASGVVPGSSWAIRPVGAPPADSDMLIKVEEALHFISRAKVTRPGHTMPVENFGCFQISHAYAEATLKILLDVGDPRFGELVSLLREQKGAGALDIVREAEAWDVSVVFIGDMTIEERQNMVPRLGPLNADTCVALSPEGRLLLPPTVDFSELRENLQKLARYRFGLRLHNPDQNNHLRGKLNLELKWRPSRHYPWRPPRIGKDGLPYFQKNDQIACVIKNNANFKVWPYILEYTEDGSVTQCYPGRGGEEELEAGRSTQEVAKLRLGVSTENAFQLAGDDTSLKTKKGSGRQTVVKVLKLFASRERIDLSLLLQSPFLQRNNFRVRGDVPVDEDEVMFSGWETVNASFVLEFDA